MAIESSAMNNTKREREFQFTQEHFDAFRKISQEYSGIVVPDSKFEMFYARLTKRLRTLRLQSFDSYLDYLQKNNEMEFTHFINALTTNLTSFFRENHHFEYLKSQIVPALAQRGQKDIRVWSAGCSTGEETYSIALTLAESCEPKNMDWRIIATDIDTNVLKHAVRGIYNLDRMENIPLPMKKRWFLKGKGTNAGFAKVSTKLRQHIEFRQLNLIKPFALTPAFDVIFCRNVVIYFNRETKIQLLNRFDQHLKAGGHLIMGHSESLHGLMDHLLSKGQTIYLKSGVAG